MATLKISSSHDFIGSKRYNFSTKSFLIGADLVGFNSLVSHFPIGCKYNSNWGNQPSVRLNDCKIRQVKGFDEYQLTPDLTNEHKRIDLSNTKLVGLNDESSEKGTLDKNTKYTWNRTKMHTRSRKLLEIKPLRNNSEINSILCSITPDCTVEKCNSILIQLERTNEGTIFQFFDWMRSNGKLEKNTDAYQLALRALARRQDWYRAKLLLNEMVMVSKCELNIKLFNSLIYICAKKGLDNWGTKWYDTMLKTGLAPNIATIGMLMGLYQKTLNISRAEFVFNHMRDYKIECAKAYSTMITIYTRLGMHEKSEKIIEIMEQDKVVPNLENWLVRLNSYSQQGKLEEAELVLESMEKASISPNIIAYNTLITGYGKISDMDSAKRVFNSLDSFKLVPDETTYRSMIEGFGRIDDYKNAFWYYEELKKSGYLPNSSNFYTMINLQARHDDKTGTVETLNDMRTSGIHYSSIIGQLIQAHERTCTVEKILDLLEASFYKTVLFDPTSCSMLAVTFVKNHLLNHAFRVLSEKKWKSNNYEGNLYHLLICSCKEEERYEDSVRVYEHMLKNRSNPNPDIHIACTMIDIFTCMGKFVEGEGVYVKLIKSGAKLDLVIYSVIVRMYIKAEKLKEACLVMETIEKIKYITPDIYLFRDMLRTYQKCDMKEKLTSTYYWIRKTRTNLDEPLYNCIINCCARALDINEISSLFDEMIRHGFRPSVITLNVMLDIYGKAGLFSKANELFNTACKRGLVNIISYNTMISTYAQIRDIEKMKLIVESMKTAGHEISLEAYNCLLDTYAKENMLVEFNDVLQQIETSKYNFDNYTYNIMISAYGRFGDIEKMKSILQTMKNIEHEISLEAYNSLLDIYGKENMLQEFNNILQEMKNVKYNYDHYTYNIMINIYARKGWIKEVSKVFKELRERGLEPDLYSYNTLIKAYGIARMPEEAVNVVNEMRNKKINPDRITFTNVITALLRNENYLEAVKWSLWMKQIYPKTI